jgi:hypothetical protein
MKSDQRGFVFSLDAALAIIVVMLALAGVARVGVRGIYEQYGYLRLQRYARDGLEALHNVGNLDENGVLTTAFDNIRGLLKLGEVAQAETVAEDWLSRIFPSDILFRLLVGENENYPLLDNVFPTPGNEEAWRSALENAPEVAVAHAVWLVGENFVPAKLYVWRWPRP